MRRSCCAGGQPGKPAQPLPTLHSVNGQWWISWGTGSRETSSITVLLAMVHLPRCALQAVTSAAGAELQPEVCCRLRMHCTVLRAVWLWAVPGWSCCVQHHVLSVGGQCCHFWGLRLDRDLILGKAFANVLKYKSVPSTLTQIRVMKARLEITVISCVFLSSTSLQHTFP